MRRTHHLGWPARSAVALAASLVIAACYPLPPIGITLVARRPPPDRVEVIGGAPGSGYIWIKGHWGWERDDFTWIAGRWQSVPTQYRTWVPGHWVHGKGGWFWVEGQWR